MSIEEIVKELKEKGLDDEGCKKALEEMLEKGEITEEDYEKALGLLGGEAEEKENEEAEEAAYAEKLFGI